MGMFICVVFFTCHPLYIHCIKDKLYGEEIEAIDLS